MQCFERKIYILRVSDVDQRSKELLQSLEWNPKSIFQNIIQREETATGIKSEKNHNASIEECLKSNEVNEIMEKNLNTLALLVEGIVNTALQEHLFGILNPLKKFV